MKREIIELLQSTKRPGMEDLIEWMDENGFFTAPCSSQYHLAKEGGLAEHSYNVYQVALDVTLMFSSKQENLSSLLNSVIIASLLHDLGKTGQFGKPNYIENMVSDRKGGYKHSEKKPFTTNPDLLYIPHEVRSIQIASQFIDLTESENWAILMHNGLYGDFKYSIQGKETPLYMILHFADMWASRIIEKEEKESEDLSVYQF